MYAVIQTGGKQYRVKEGDILFVEKLPGEKAQQIVFEQVLMVGGQEGQPPQIGVPLLDKARVACEVLEQFKSKKLLVFKAKRRKKYRLRKGHRQNYTRLRVLEIAADGQLTGKRYVKASAAQVAPVGFESVAVETSKD